MTMAVLGIDAVAHTAQAMPSTLLSIVVIAALLIVAVPVIVTTAVLARHAWRGTSSGPAGNQLLKLVTLVLELFRRPKQ
ncbi:hypothetical protein [Kineosporia sp. A_224]|uniref:hypothetical protein n=1 Tax=Kineosporia sp. A_224 TaxID=1962180 RepID=UPI000B4ABB08|nr:hypothetical protein [Kineosporia sp. A_224]